MEEAHRRGRGQSMWSECGLNAVYIGLHWTVCAPDVLIGVRADEGAQDDSTSTHREVACDCVRWCSVPALRYRCTRTPPEEGSQHVNA